MFSQNSLHKFIYMILQVIAVIVCLFEMIFFYLERNATCAHAFMQIYVKLGTNLN